VWRNAGATYGNVIYSLGGEPPNGGGKDINAVYCLALRGLQRHVDLRYVTESLTLVRLMGEGRDGEWESVPARHLFSIEA